MVLATYGANFQAQSALILRGSCHLLMVGDSQTYQARNFSLASVGLLARLKVRWNYVIGALATAPQTGTYCQTGGVGDTIVGTSTGYGSLVGDVTSGVGTPALGAPTTKVAFSGNSTATDWTWTAPNNQGGWLLQRECAASTTKANQYMPWPLLSTNTYMPWFHGKHMKIGVVVQGQSAGNGVLSAGFGCRRVGGSVTGAASWSDLAITDAATIQNIGYTSAVADAGTYQSTIGNGLLNDHNVQLGARSASGYDETGKSLIFMRGIWARTDGSGNFEWNNTDQMDSGAGYDSIGRSGSAITDWESNYWSQTQWKEYFTATVLVPNRVTVMAVMLGHNCIQVSGGVVTAAFSTSWNNFIAKVRAAYAAAFPTGTYPNAKLHIMIITPWYNATESNFMSANGVAGGRSMQAAYETLAATNADCSWFSYFNYFNEAEPFDTLHADNEISGAMLADAFVNTLHAATDLKYSEFATLSDGVPKRRRAGVR